MKRVLLFAALFISGANLVFAQNNGPASPRDKKLVDGYTICPRTAASGTYVYDIFVGGRCVLHQVHNPFTGSPIGLKSVEDVYKVATWQIRHGVPHPGSAQLKSSGLALRDPASSMASHKRLISRVPKGVAKQLNISIDNQ